MDVFGNLESKILTLPDVNKFDLEKRLIDFAVRILKLAESLPATTAARHLGGQITRSGTSPALNYGEAIGAESQKDFIHKMKICLKELRETHVCLKIIHKMEYFPEAQISPILKECNELVAIFVSSCKTAKSKLN